MTFTSSYFTSADNRPAGIEPAYRLLDATLRLAESDDRWEIALIGRNLTNKYYFDRSLGVTFTGGPAGTAAPAPSDVAAVVSRGREMMVRGTWKFN
jgi:iron complex outermembrane receptor protein